MKHKAGRRVVADSHARTRTPSGARRKGRPRGKRTSAALRASSLWDSGALYSADGDRYERWWMELTRATRRRIDTAIDKYGSYDRWEKEYLRYVRPGAVIIKIAPAARLDQFRASIPEVSVEEFSKLLQGPVAERKTYAEAYGKRITQILKDFLEVPSNRPKVQRSEADLSDDKWLLRLAVYNFNFPPDAPKSA